MPNPLDPEALKAQVTGVISRANVLVAKSADPSFMVEPGKVLLDAKDLQAHLNESPPVTDHGDLGAIAKRIKELGARLDHLADWYREHGGTDAKYFD